MRHGASPLRDLGHVACLSLALVAVSVVHISDVGASAVVDALAGLFVPKPTPQASVVCLLVSRLGVSVRQRPLVYVAVLGIWSP